MVVESADDRQQCVWAAKSLQDRKQSSIILAPDMLESQSRALKTQTIS